MAQSQDTHGGTRIALRDKVSPRKAMWKICWFSGKILVFVGLRCKGVLVSQKNFPRLLLAFSQMVQGFFLSDCAIAKVLGFRTNMVLCIVMYSFSDWSVSSCRCGPKESSVVLVQQQLWLWLPQGWGHAFVCTVVCRCWSWLTILLMLT